MITRVLDKIYSVLRDFLSGFVVSNGTAIAQKNLMASYKLMSNLDMEPLKFSDISFRVNSQFDEDGILLYIFSIIGERNKKCVELCAGDGIECNTSNLILNHRWIGLLFDGDVKKVNKARKFYRRNLESWFWPPVISHKWVTKENVNDIILENGFSGEIDLLSLDIDGVDYFVWDNITCISPRVVVLEFNHLWGSNESVTVPYSDDFCAEFTSYGSDYAGASLQAFIKMGHKKGYKLIGVNSISTNAFFLRDDIKHGWLPEVDPEDCFDHPRAQFGIKSRLPAVKEKKWIAV